MHPVVVRDPVPPDAIRPLKRTEYERLAEAGAFASEKVELLFGRIVRMSPQGVNHAGGIQWLGQHLVAALIGPPCACSPRSSPRANPCPSRTSP